MHLFIITRFIVLHQRLHFLIIELRLLHFLLSLLIKLLKFFKGESKPVNEDLSVIFLATHLSERIGKGVPLIVSKYGRDAFEINESSIKVTIPYNWKHKFEADIVEKKIINLKNLYDNIFTII